MNRPRLAALALALILGGCVAATHQKSAALRMPWPRSPAPALTAYAPPANTYPSVGGDILAGAKLPDPGTARPPSGTPTAP